MLCACQSSEIFDIRIFAAAWPAPIQLYRGHRSVSSHVCTPRCLTACVRAGLWADWAARPATIISSEVVVAGRRTADVSSLLSISLARAHCSWRWALPAFARYNCSECSSVAARCSRIHRSHCSCTAISLDDEKSARRDANTVRAGCSIRRRQKFSPRRKLSFWFGMEPPMRRSRSKSAHKCIPYNNRCVQNFIQIG